MKFIHRGKGGKAGRQGKGGCGVGLKKKVLYCQEYPCCKTKCEYGGTWGNDCAVNKDGKTGNHGSDGLSIPSNSNTQQIIDKRLNLTMPFMKVKIPI